MGLYARYVLPKLIDQACGQKPMAVARAEYVPRATGRVLEIGIGSGHNIEHYGATVDAVTAIDPATEVTDLAQQRIARSSIPIELINASAETIPFDDDTFDSVVSTWTLCSIPNVYRTLAEIRRVVKPGGQFIFLEHGLSPDRTVAGWQRAIEPAWKIIGGGCHLTRHAANLIVDAGFALRDSQTGYFPGPKWAAFMYRGVAVPR